MRLFWDFFCNNKCISILLFLSDKTYLDFLLYLIVVQTINIELYHRIATVQKHIEISPIF